MGRISVQSWSSRLQQGPNCRPARKQSDRQSRIRAVREQAARASVQWDGNDIAGPATLVSPDKATAKAQHAPNQAAGLGEFAHLVAILAMTSPARRVLLGGGWRAGGWLEPVSGQPRWSQHKSRALVGGPDPPLFACGWGEKG